MGRWFLVRHGETEWNRTGKILGHSDIPLNVHGHWQVMMLARRLVDENLSVAYSSDLLRATETAQVLTEGRALAIETDSALREFSYGAWEGLTLVEVETEHSSTFAEQLDLGDQAFAAPEGESTPQLLNRVRRFVTRIMRQQSAADNVLIVTHAGPIRALLVCLLDLADDHFWRFKVDCAGLSVVSKEPQGSVLELWNDTDHLRPTL